MAHFFKSRAEIQKVHGEKKEAQTECTQAILRLDLTQAKWDDAQKA
jgi:hypothetical protein